MQAERQVAMRKAGIRPEIICTHKKTGLLLMAVSPAPPKDRKAWNDAIDVYFRLEGEAEDLEANAETAPT
jgi:hypothetical protein